MQIRKICLILIILLYFTSCSSSYENLSKNTFNPPDDFSKYLFIEYQKKANFEAKEMHDWNSAKLYSEKSIKASNGIKVKPEIISFWKVDTKHKIILTKAYDNLMDVYEDAIEKDPYNLAVAISSLDCWAEQQEENWQTWDISKCKKDFLNAMHNIFLILSDYEKNSLEENSKNQSEDSVVVVTKEKNKKIKQIIYFDFDKSNLNEVSLQEIKNFLDKYKSEIDKYLIVGHTDTKGTKEYNLKLSLKRAKKVREILIDFGVDINSIKILSKGEDELAVHTKDEVKHPANRRAEIKKLN